jgi:hypothetical protein
MCSNDIEGSQSSLREFSKEINSEMVYVWPVSSKRLRINFPRPFGNSEQHISTDLTCVRQLLLY